WFRILADLRDRGLTHCDVAREIDVPRTRVRDWYAKGVSPRFDDGALLVMLWLNKCKDFNGGINYLAIQSSSTAEQLAAACLSIRFVELPRTGRETR
ncbi:MAG: hypothetical protein NUV74_10310, partial [Candidatus Brocadiaceae bacterium]|nr:hypothetical protein [Candidatus Brocadiaceae bacterium]